MNTDAEQTVLRVVNTDATPEEIAALAIVFLTSQTPTTPTRATPSEWSVSRRRQRATLPHGPAGWRSSALPRH